MKRKVILLILLFVGLFFIAPKVNAEGNNVSVSYQTHVQKIGWQNAVSDGQMSGTSGLGLRLEAIKINVQTGEYTGGIKYNTHVQKIGWQNKVYDGQLSGTSGQGLRLEAIQIELTGELAQHYDIYYRVHAQKFGWLGWARNGYSAGTSGYGYRLEGIQIKLVKKGTVFDEYGEKYIFVDKTAGKTIVRPDNAKLSYTTHVQKEGWQDRVYEGKMSGTSGKGYRLEGIKINLEGDALNYSGTIKYRTHVQKIGWQDWKYNGEMSGTSGKGLRLEGIEIQLTGDLSDYYDICYRTHVQSIGWQDWKYNGEMSGTSGLGLRLEAIEIKLLRKNYAVTFDSNGGTQVASQTVNRGGVATKPADPTRYGYQFAGWTLNEENYDFSSKVNDDLTLKAKWIQTPRTPIISSSERKNQDDPQLGKAYNVNVSQYTESGDGFEIWKKETKTGEWTRVRRKSWDTQGDTNLVRVPWGEKFAYKMRTYTIEDGKDYYSEFSNEIELVGIGTPTSSNNDQFSTNGATGVEIYMSIDDGEYNLVNTYTNADGDTFDHSCPIIAGADTSCKARYFNTYDGETIYGSFADISNFSAKYTQTPQLTITGETKRSFRVAVQTSNFMKDFNGIEIYYSTSRNGSYSLLVSEETEGHTSWMNATDETLDMNQTYYFKARYYNNYNGHKYYSDYSSIVEK